KKCNYIAITHGRSRAAAPTEVVEHSCSAKPQRAEQSRRPYGDCEMQLNCNAPAEGAERSYIAI
ncbi:MAG: hypothetical protein RSC01_07310, partial [Oscillospiraceae bacterium]